MRGPFNTPAPKHRLGNTGGRSFSKQLHLSFEGKKGLGRPLPPLLNLHMEVYVYLCMRICICTCNLPKTHIELHGRMDCKEETNMLDSFNLWSHFGFVMPLKHRPTCVLMSTLESLQLVLQQRSFATSGACSLGVPFEVARKGKPPCLGPYLTHALMFAPFGCSMQGPG